jgi:hypothetical protein
MQSPRSSLLLPPTRTFAPGHPDCGKRLVYLQPDGRHRLSQPWRQVPSFMLLSDIPFHFGMDDIGWHFPLKQVVCDVAAA